MENNPKNFDLISSFAKENERVFLVFREREESLVYDILYWFFDFFYYFFSENDKSELLYIIASENEASLYKVKEEKVVHVSEIPSWKSTYFHGFDSFECGKFTYNFYRNIK